MCAGCTNAIAGTARPAPGLKPTPLTGEVIKQVLLDDEALAMMLDQSFKADPALPPRFGGPDKLGASFGDVSPDECAGISTLAGKAAYQSADVRNVAHESWWVAGEDGKVISVAESVVALPTAADATALFAKFTQQWNACNGKTVTITGSRLSQAEEVTEVRLDNSVLAATIYVESSGSAGTRRPEARAVGVRVNCLVEVEISFFSVQRPSDKGSADLHTSAVDIARVMMGKVSSRS